MMIMIVMRILEINQKISKDTFRNTDGNTLDGVIKDSKIKRIL
jgi:hypothetical protein